MRRRSIPLRRRHAMVQVRIGPRLIPLPVRARPAHAIMIRAGGRAASIVPLLVVGHVWTRVVVHIIIPGTHLPLALAEIVRSHLSLEPLNVARNGLGLPPKMIVGAVAPLDAPLLLLHELAGLALVVVRVELLGCGRGVRRQRHKRVLVWVVLERLPTVKNLQVRMPVRAALVVVVLLHLARPFRLELQHQVLEPLIRNRGRGVIDVVEEHARVPPRGHVALSRVDERTSFTHTTFSAILAKIRLKNVWVVTEFDCAAIQDVRKIRPGGIRPIVDSHRPSVSIRVVAKHETIELFDLCRVHEWRRRFWFFCVM
eukprot:comp24085_c2_seq1/m.43393 comp24085_c2_seq1/g.43393  ORF comp24085_c2_seq1/g.43393 comp24085_c2_seq1/m.43393 type:complete len:313 (+) comp24085_c2_seq1:1732-2670(+)